MLELPPLPPAVHTLNNEDSDRLKREAQEALAPDPRHCRTCGGRGSFLWYARASVDWRPGDPDEVSEYKCPCDDQWVLNRYLLHCGIPTNYQRLGWADFDNTVPPDINEYLSHASEIMDAGLGLLLYGPEGNGKTMLSVLILKGLIKKGNAGYFTTFAGLVERFNEGRFDRQERDWYKRRVKNAMVLVIDDVGQEMIRRTMAWERDGTGKSSGGTAEGLYADVEFTFTDVIRHRVGMNFPTLVTTNLDPAKLETKYGHNVISLLNEHVVQILVPGADYRVTIKNRRTDEVYQGLRRPVVL